MKDLHSTKQLTPEQFGPGLVSTSCISLEDTSAVLAEKLSDVRIAVAAMRTTAGLVTACCFGNFESQMPQIKSAVSCAASLLRTHMRS